MGFTPANDRRGSGVVRNDAGSDPGFNLFTTPHLCSATLMDETGGVQNFWQEEPCGRWSDAELTTDGELLVLGVEAGQKGDPDDPSARRFLMKLTWQGRRAWKRALPRTTT